MKYKDKIIIAILVLVMALSASYAADAYQSFLKIKDKTIRLHIIANSNSIEDQNLKLKIRNEIIKETSEKFTNISSKEESEEIIISKLEDIKVIAEKTIKENGYNYPVKVFYGNFDFPRKQYDDIILPAGRYDAVRVVIGEGVGDNWWCVMFPALCFVDFGKADDTDETFDTETEEKLSEILTEEEIEMIKIGRGLLDIKLKSKIVEIIERGKIENAGIDAEEDDEEVYAAVSSITWGARGETVREIQRRLKDWGYYTGNVDGIFGEKTFAAVKEFQRKNGLDSDGIVGPKTAEALGINLRKADITYDEKKESGSSVSRYDNVYLLARAVYGESRGEPYVGKVAVAAVILNRVEHPDFPNTIAGVIYQPGAFTAVSDGQIQLQPDESSIKAANDAINGWDPSYGCRYYWNPATATSKWIWSRSVVIKIGKHWFGN